MSEEIKISITGDTKSLDDSLSSSMSRAEKAIKIKIEKPLDSALSGTKNKIKTNVEDPLKKAGDETEKSFGKKFGEAFVGQMALPNLASAVFLAGKAFDVAAMAGENFFNVFKGEKLLKIEKQFDAMASSFGVSGEIARAFESRGGGLFQGEDMMQSLTEKLITFEGKIEKMPDLFTAARKAANLFGGDAMDMFEKLSFAAQTGNTKSLRFIFPKLDLEKEIEKYALSQNKLASEISQVEIQQVRLNTILEEANKRLANVSAESDSTASAWVRFKNVIGDIGDESSKATAKSAGFFSTFLNGMADIIKGGPKAVSDIKSMSEAMENQAMVLRELKAKELDLAKYRESQAGRVRGDDPWLVNRIKGLKALSKEYDDYIAKQKRREEVNVGMNGPNLPSKGYTSALDEINKQLRDKLAQAKLLVLNGQYSAEKTLENLNAVNAAKEKQNYAQTLTDKLAILKDYQAKTLISDEQFEQYRAQILKGGTTGNSNINASLALAEQAANQRRLDNEKWFYAEKKRLADEAYQKSIVDQTLFADSWTDNMKGFGKLIQGNIAELNKNYTKTMQNIAATSYNGLVAGVGGAVKNMTLAFRNGQDGLQAFGEAMLATLGDVMVQMGSSFIAMAIPMFWSPIPEHKASAPGLLAGGVGLVAAGALLSASVGNGSTQGLGGTTGNAGGGVSGGTVDPDTPKAYRPEDLVETKQQPKIEINFAGNLLNNKESALYIAEVLQDAAFSNDIRFAGV